MKDIISLSEINSTDWNTRKVIKAGISAEAPVFWLSDEEKKKVSILVGHDDEVWDFGVVIDNQYFLKEINQFIYDKPILF